MPARRLLTAFIFMALAPAATADILPKHLAEARSEWNKVGDRAAAGDKQALRQLEEVSARCTQDPACKGPLANPYSATQQQIDAGFAATNLAWLYLHGKSVKKNEAYAYILYRAAADRGNPVGHHNLAVAYNIGKGAITKNRELAIKHFKAAEILGMDDAAFELGEIYRSSGKTLEANYFYKRALKLNPGKDIAEKATQVLATLPAPKIGMTAASNKPAPAAPVASAQPKQPDPAIMTKGRTCIAMGKEADEGKKELRKYKRDLDKWRKALKTETNNLAFLRDHAVTPEKWRDFQAYEAEVNADGAAFNDEQRNYNREVDRYTAFLADYKNSCMFSVNRLELEALCSGADAGSRWCKAYKKS
ncbi:tetratricopeptide repeat protein [Pseudokordiimonas caeni]|uniref:tetratricopeptide repeat protein n=1 Tax=Pseudokordiimonas caeni TaxID=2997908 RepID=UPI0028124D4D|nr:tetratricopeptide repeat protein [Pseudokordiimonas caeni]